MEKYFGYAKELLEAGLAKEHEPYDARNTYDEVITETDDIPLYVELAKSCNGTILDLGCGTGRIMKPLLEAGHTVIGLDLSEHMLTIARKKVEEAGFAPRFVQGDMRDFDLGETFGMVMIPYCAMIYMQSDEDRMRVLQSVHRHLAPGGILVYDFDASSCAVGESRPWLSAQKRDPRTGEVYLQTALMKCEVENLRIINLIDYWVNPDHSTILIQANLEATCSAERMGELLEEAGFAVQGFYEDYEYAPYQGGELCVAIALKPVN